jgi:hypothetical protein
MNSRIKNDDDDDDDDDDDVNSSDCRIACVRCMKDCLFPPR